MVEETASAGRQAGEGPVLVQDYLVSHSLADLRAEHGVKACVRGYKCGLEYDQIASRGDDALANQCRGLVLATVEGLPWSEDGPVGETVVLARPFDRFFNLGSPHAAPIDWATARVQEKLDGTLIIVYFDPFTRQWDVATRGTPLADGPVVKSSAELTFAELFYRVFARCREQDFATWAQTFLARSRTYLFELVGEINRVVVRYPEEQIYWLGERDNLTGKEFPVSQPSSGQAEGKLRVPSTYLLSDPDRLVEELRGLSPVEHEGVVVCDAQFRRVKVKTPNYVLVHALTDRLGGSPRNLLRLVLQGYADDLLPWLKPELAEALLRYRAQLARWSQELEQQIAQGRELVRMTDMNDRAQRKAFALYCQTHQVWLAPALALWQGTATDGLSWLRAQPPNDRLLDTVLRELRKGNGVPSPDPAGEGLTA